MVRERALKTSAATFPKNETGEVRDDLGGREPKLESQARLTASEEGLGRGDATKMQSNVMRPSGSGLPMGSFIPADFQFCNRGKTRNRILRTTGAAQSIEIAAVSEIFGEVFDLIT